LSEPLVLALLVDQVDPARAAALAAGFEEEGVPLTVAAASGTALALARDAAARALLGVGIGGDRDGLALVLAGAPRRPYLRAAIADARAFGHDAARIAARRPLRHGLG
jgi:hypothetical protein